MSIKTYLPESSPSSKWEVIKGFIVLGLGCLWSVGAVGVVLAAATVVCVGMAKFGYWLWLL
jgi:hypothetical protein